MDCEAETAIALGPAPVPCPGPGPPGPCPDPVLIDGGTRALVAEADGLARVTTTAEEVNTATTQKNSGEMAYCPHRRHRRCPNLHQTAEDGTHVSSAHHDTAPVNNVRHRMAIINQKTDAKKGAGISTRQA